MAEYIEREKVKDELLSWAVCINHPEHLLREDALCVIDSIPAADVEVVKHGRWIEKEYGTYLPVECDENGDLILHHFVKYICDQCRRVENEKEPYCNCGCKMDLEGTNGLDQH